MAKNNFEASLKLVLEHEGGYVNHPRDPGGATNYGVTQAVYDSYRAINKLPTRSVRYIAPAEVRAVYKMQYWDRVQGDLLPIGLDYAVFDYAVNSGVNRASKYLQAVLGVAQDGQIGAQTLAAIDNPRAAIIRLCDKRMGFLRGLRTFLTFGRGWTRRVQGVRGAALLMVAS